MHQHQHQCTLATNRAHIKAHTNTTKVHLKSAINSKPHKGLFNYVCEGADAVMQKALELAAEVRETPPMTFMLERRFHCSCDTHPYPCSWQICETSPMSSMLNRHLIIRNGHSTSPEEAHLIESR